jgi:NitT/TauT family transport system substrate-binding protein
MKTILRALIAAAVAALSIGTASAADTIRIAAQKTGTFAWELAVIRAHGLDKEANLTLDVRELASPEAGKIALRSGDADIMISDWLWVSRERSLGAKLTFYPYSSALGAVMVESDFSLMPSCSSEACSNSQLLSIGPPATASLRPLRSASVLIGEVFGTITAPSALE